MTTTKSLAIFQIFRAEVTGGSLLVPWEPELHLVPEAVQDLDILDENCIICSNKLQRAVMTQHLGIREWSMTEFFRSELDCWR